MALDRLVRPETPAAGGTLADLIPVLLLASPAGIATGFAPPAITQAFRDDARRPGSDSSTKTTPPCCTGSPRRWVGAWD